MAEEKKRRGRRAYLEDFQKTATGEYVYTGKLHYYETQGLERRQALLRLWLLTGAIAAAVVVSGCVPAAGMSNTFYVLLPYAGALLSAASVVWLPEGTLCATTFIPLPWPRCGYGGDWY